MGRQLDDKLPPPFRVTFRNKEEAKTILSYLGRHGAKKGPAAYAALLDAAKKDEEKAPAEVGR